MQEKERNIGFSSENNLMTRVWKPSPQGVTPSRVVCPPRENTATAGATW